MANTHPPPGQVPYADGTAGPSYNPYAHAQNSPQPPPPPPMNMNMNMTYPYYPPGANPYAAYYVPPPHHHHPHQHQYNMNAHPGPNPRRGRGRGGYHNNQGYRHHNNNQHHQHNQNQNYDRQQQQYVQYSPNSQHQPYHPPPPPHLGYGVPTSPTAQYMVPPPPQGAWQQPLSPTTMTKPPPSAGGEASPLLNPNIGFQTPPGPHIPNGHMYYPPPGPPIPIVPPPQHSPLVSVPQPLHQQQPEEIQQNGLPEGGAEEKEPETDIGSANPSLVTTEVTAADTDSGLPETSSAPVDARPVELEGQPQQLDITESTLLRPTTPITSSQTGDANEASPLLLTSPLSVGPAQPTFGVHVDQPATATDEPQLVPTSPLHSVTAQPLPASPTFASTLSDSEHPRPETTLAIWRRRPTNPVQAPGIIISPRARPPKEVRGLAIGARTPPPDDDGGGKFAFGDVSVEEAEKIGVEVEEVEQGVVVGRDVRQVDAEAEDVKETETEIETEGEQDAEKDATQDQARSSSASTATTETEGTETETDGRMTTAVESSNTSVSGSPARDVGKTTLAAGSTATVVPAKVEETQSAEKNEIEQIEQPQQPAATAAKPKPASWSALFSSPGQRNGLPTSSVVGFSVPAEARASTIATNSDPSIAGIDPAKRNALVKLLLGSAAAPTAGVGAWGSGGSASGSAILKSSTSAGGVGTGKIRARGLYNTGNMCFANAVLQAMVYCAPFRALFSELAGLLPKAGERESKTPLVDATVTFLKEFTGAAPGVNAVKITDARKKENRDGEEDGEEEKEYFTPTFVYDALRRYKRFESIGNGQQEDAEEFFGFYLDTLDEELQSLAASLTSSSATAPAVQKKMEAPEPEEDGWEEVGSKSRTKAGAGGVGGGHGGAGKDKVVVTRRIGSERSPIMRIFGGRWRESTKVAGRKDSVMISDWRALGLDIEPDSVHTIEDALSLIPKPRSVSIASPQGATVEGSQQTLVEALPNILVLHLKRFAYDAKVMSIRKIGKGVRFGTELEIAQELLTPTARRPLPAKYSLFGALHHLGANASAGHYTLHLLHPQEGWKYFDDELVRPSSPGDVVEIEENRAAYLLFYRRVR